MTTQLIDLFDAGAPPIPLPEVERMAASLFGVHGKAKALSGERDQNFHLRTEDGPGYVFKVHPPAEDPAVVDFQVRALQHIASIDPGVVVPRVILSLDGAPSVPVDLGAGRPQLARLLSYLPGSPVGEHKPLSPVQLYSLGDTLGRLDRALRGFFHPAGGYPLLWDPQRAPQLRPLLEHIPDQELRDAVARGLDAFETHTQPRLLRLRAQPIHNDANNNNVLLDTANLDSVSGVLDFGDMVHGPLVQELAIAANYHLGLGADPFEPIGPLVRGFHARVPLEPEELDILPALILARLLVSATMWSWLVRDDAEELAELRQEIPFLRDRLARVTAAVSAPPSLRALSEQLGFGVRGA